MDMGDSVNDTWLWRLKWRRSFFAWEEELFMKLLETIEPVPITKKDDLWTCIYGETFTVSLLYEIFYKRFIPPPLFGLSLAEAIAKVWDSWAPWKVIVFS
jgi:hypothetical protein